METNIEKATQSKPFKVCMVYEREGAPAHKVAAQQQ
jgi:hypothetical protein